MRQAIEGTRGAVRAALAAAMAGWTAACVALAASADERPNVLVMLADDVGPEVLGCYGGQSYPTPRLDRLAAEGLRCEQASVMPMCHPTRICLLTGQYPFRLGNPAWGSFPRDREGQTLAHVLRRAGYATCAAGKWQLALLQDDPDQPRRMGFDAFCLHAWHEGPWYYRPRIWQNGRLREDVADRYGPDVIDEFLRAFLERHRDERFFAYYAPHLCHDETNDLPEPAPYGPLGRYETYAERVAQLDARVGRMLDALETLGLRERTLVLFLADNGTPARFLASHRDGQYVYQPFASRRHGREVRGGKGTLAEAGVRAPWIVRWPGKVAAGQVSDALTDVSDVLPTLAEVAGAALPEGVRLDGRPLLDAEGRVAAQRRWVFAEHRGQKHVRNRRWKLYGDGRLFDLEADAGEERPLPVDDPSPAAIAAR